MYVLYWELPIIGDCEMEQMICIGLFTCHCLNFRQKMFLKVRLPEQHHITTRIQ